MRELERMIDREKVDGHKRKMDFDFDPRFLDKVGRIVEYINLPGLLYNACAVSGVDNAEKIKNKQVIYISNHLSLSDFDAWGYIFWKLGLPAPRYIAGKNLFVPPFGYVMRRCGAIPILRKNRSREYLIAQDEIVKQCLTAGESMLTFPEEGRSENGLRDFKKSIFRQVVEVAEKLKTEIYIQPLHIGFDNIPDSKYIGVVRAIKNRADVSEGAKRKILELGAFYVDGLSYLHRMFLEKEKGLCYASFGEPFIVRSCTNKQKRDAIRELVDKTRGEITRLDNEFHQGQSYDLLYNFRRGKRITGTLIF